MASELNQMADFFMFFVKIALGLVLLALIAFLVFVILMFGIGFYEWKQGKKSKARAEELETLMDEIGESAKRDEKLLQQLKTLKKRAKISQAVAGVFICIAILTTGYAFFKWSLFARNFNSSWPPETIITADGEWEVSRETVNKLFYAVKDGEVEVVEKMLSENPELIYYRWEDFGSIDVLNQALVFHHADVAECFLRHGAKFDSKEQLESGEYSMEQFISYRMSVLSTVGSSEEDNQMLRFMMEHGAQVTFGQESYHPNALFAYISWIDYDEKIGEGEIEIIREMIERGASLTIENMHGQNPLEFFEERVERENQDPQVYHRIQTLLQVAK
ncbi:MAG: ankyrin repeat domain-containing protein [Peptostreptococcaceae bacterium]|nr:ankyrin repeat domain-containing protein [Peptostreptococcaceae bacterium]